MLKDSIIHAKLKTAKREFDSLEPSSNSRIEIRKAEVADLLKAIKFGNDAIPGGLSSIDDVKQVIVHNSDNAFIFERRQQMVGFYAMLMLNSLGLERLLLNEFNTSYPDPSCLSRTNERPAAIYKWAVFATGMAADGIKHISHFLKQPKFKKANYFTKPVSEAGLQICLNLGFRPVTCSNPGLYRYVRISNRTQDCFPKVHEG